MIIGSARKKQTQLQSTSHLEEVRKFGNIVNRFEKSSSNIQRKGDNFENKYGGTQNIIPSHYMSPQESSHYIQNRSYIAKNIHDIETKSIPTETQIINDCQNKKDAAINRNRQFDEKVDNINKIHEQINCLLKYVKTGQSKSVIKSKEPWQNKISKYQQNRDIAAKQRSKDSSAIKQRKGQIVTNRSYLDQKTEINQIKPITQQQKKANLYYRYNQPNKLHEEKLQNKIQNLQDDKLRKTLNYYLKPNIEAKKTGQAYTQRNLTSRLNITSDLNDKKIDKNSKPFNYRDLQNSTTIKIPLCTQTPQKNSKKGEDGSYKKQSYNYNFDSGNQQTQQILKPRNLLTKYEKSEKIQRSIIDYDQQILKVKERIQSSQQMMKKMQQKYLGPQIVKNRQQNLVSQIQIFQCQPQSIQNKYHQQNKTRMNGQKLTYLNKSNISSNVDNRKFQLKVHKCQSHSDLKKDDVCGMIAEKLSTQVKLDQKLRDARQIFNECKANDKWKILQQKLKRLGFNFKQQELQSQLAISSNQYNPFVTNSDLNVLESVENLAQSFSKSQKFWEKQLYRFLPRDNVNNSGFKIQQMDLDHRGYLTVQDLVCFINLYTTNFFRNRDLIYLYRRIMALGKNRNGIQYQCFMDIITHP